MTLSARQAYDSLLAHLRQIACVSAIHEQLAWDELTLLPEEATEHRGKQLAYVAGLAHELSTDPRLEDWLPAAAKLSAQDEEVRINVEELTRRHRLSKLQPKSLVEELARVTTTAQHEWAIAREADDYGRFALWLDRVVKLKREQARCWTADHDLYAPLVAEYEPGLPYEVVLQAIAELTRELPDLVIRAQSRQRPAPKPTPLQGSFPKFQQQAFAKQIAGQLGFDFRRGRIDAAVHPFTTHISAHDCRIALRYDERNLAPLISLLLHELGHALYDQGLPPEHHGLPVGEPISLSVHESQARLWENAIGRSLGFWRFLLPLVEHAFPQVRGSWTAEKVASHLHRVEPGVNRVRADEVTYNLHIAIRVDLERKLIADDLRASDLPDAWNAAYRQLLDVTPATNREGCLQDGHWAAGMFGYFPTYALGNVLMALQFEHLQRELGPLDDLCARGDFAPIIEWLRTNLFQHGKRFTTSDWAQRLSAGKSQSTLDVQPLLRRLAREITH
jgi:carboxypeptidase Taq